MEILSLFIKNKKQKKWINKILNEFERNVRADEMKGAAPPQEYEVIKLNYKAARIVIFNHISELYDLAYSRDI